MNPTKRSETLTIDVLDGANGTRILKLAGQLTLQTLFEFQNVVREETSKPVVLDFSGLEYMDSAGLGCVIGAFTSCQRNKRGFAIIGLSDRIRSLLQVTHVDGLLPSFDSLAAAESAVAGSVQA